MKDISYADRVHKDGEGIAKRQQGCIHTGVAGWAAPGLRWLRLIEVPMLLGFLLFVLFCFLFNIQPYGILF
jgi:hypothetical protein